MNLPDYNFLSAPLWLISVLHVLTLSLHMAAMNFLFGGLLLVLWGKFSHRWEDETVKRFVKLFPSVMAATVSLGVAPLLFVQLVYARQVYAAAIVSGWFWLMIVTAVILGYYMFYLAAFDAESGGRRKKIPLLVALIVLVYVSLVYSTVFSLGERPDLIRQLYASNQDGLTWNPALGEYIFRWLHMVLGAVTVGGFFFGLLGRDDPEAFAAGKKFFLWGMVFASTAGLAYTFTLGDYIVPFMRTPAVWALLAGILLSVGSIHFFFRRSFLPASLMLGVSLVCMVTVRQYLRLVRLADHFDPASLKIQPQWSPLLMFLICFVIALALIWYMLVMFFRGRVRNS